MVKINHKQAALDFLSFVNASPTPFHAVKSSKDLLTAAGFEQIREKDSWASKLQPGGKYYLTKNGSTIFAFAIGKKWKPGNSVAMIGAHTDSPVLKIKPVSKKQGEGFFQVGVETYGGGIWHTWFDRDLSVAGRVMVREKDGNIQQKLVKVDRPILRIPTLAIHLERKETFEFNKETQLFPITGLVEAEINKSKEQQNGDSSQQQASDTTTALKPLTERHHPFIIDLIASELDAKPSDIVDFELTLYDTQKSCLGGIFEEFIFSPRLDNLEMSFCAVQGLIESLRSENALDNESNIRLIALFDHEEIGSKSAHGADSDALPAVLRRLSALPAKNADSSSTDLTTAYEQSIATSFLLSVDMAHSVNPNYNYKYESDHKPHLNKGPVIKVNSNQRYATNSPGIVLLQEVAQKAVADGGDAVPLQLFVIRNDSSCGSTIGPMLSAKLGARTLDLGNPQLSMHSIRETGGTQDVGHAIRLFASFFDHYSTLAPTILVD